MERWRLLDLEYPEAPVNLALEEALAREIGTGRSPPTLRLWRNRRAAIIGENQAANEELQLKACRDLHVEVVRRFTGGGAVYHDLGNLNYSICARRPSPSNLEFQQMLLRHALDCAVETISRLGLEPERVPTNSVMIRGRKISGGAAAIRWGAVFYHGSILVNSDLDMIWRVLRQERSPKFRGLVQSIRAPVISLEKALGRELSLDQVKNTMASAFREIFTASLTPQTVTTQELSTAAGLLNEKYSREEWNLRK